MQLDQDTLFPPISETSTPETSTPETSTPETPVSPMSDERENPQTTLVETEPVEVVSRRPQNLIEEPKVQSNQPQAEPAVSAPSVGSAWDRLAIQYQNSTKAPTNVVGYGPGIGTETEYRLLGPVQSKRFLDLGCGGAQSLIAAAKQGAIAIGVDISVEQLAYGRRLVEQEEVKVELKHGDLAELAFQRADGVDIVFSAYALQYVADLNRVLRQVHRVLKPQGVFVFSLPHPVGSVTGRSSGITHPADQMTIDVGDVAVVRSYFDRSPIADYEAGSGLVEYHRTVSDIFMGLVRSGFRIDVVLEPNLDELTRLPRALIIRARKEA